MSGDGLVTGEDGITRCWWGSGDPRYRAYHDHEWGRPMGEDARLFEKICLEGFQSGLSWLTILRKRDDFRRAFAGFDFHAVARFGEEDVERLLLDAGIVRHRKKIESTINNARRAVAMAAERGSLAAWFWGWEPAGRPPLVDKASIPGKTAASVAMSKALKGLGWSFVGPTTAYAFMQAMGLVNDHLVGCAFHDAVNRDRAAFAPPR